MERLIPVVGGFNDGKHIDPAGRTKLKMARPTSTPPESNSIHYNDQVGFEYEIYHLREIHHGNNNILHVFAIDGMTNYEIIEKLIFGYKQYNKKKA